MKATRSLVGAVCLTLAASGAAMGEDAAIERGRYLVKVAGCNDCHTADYMLHKGEVRESEWLLGNTTGWRGFWGTTYATNLRLYLQPFSEEQWLTVARNKPARPPMPWYALRDMSDEDLRALYRYIRHLGPAGSSAPAFVPPDQEPVTAYVLMAPQEPATGGRPATAPQAEPKKPEKSFWDFDFKSAPPRMERP